MTGADHGHIAASAAEIYNEFFVPALFDQWPANLLDSAGVRRGDRVLDVGCGTGVLARAASNLVGDHGHVVGVDPNEGMLAVARRTPGIVWKQGAAEDLDFPDAAFDHVVSQFVMMFVEDRRRAAQEMARVLVPGGRLAIATWASLDETPGYAAMAGLLDRLFGSDAANALRQPYVLGDPDRLVELYSPDFADLEVRQHAGVARFDSIEAWVHTEIRGWTLSDMPADDYRSLLKEARKELATFTDSRGRVEFPAPALIASGTVRR
jgi:SAM-dependent methyltransferase